MAIFILEITHSLSGLGNKDNLKTRRETFKLWDLVGRILEVRWHIEMGPDIFTAFLRLSEWCMVSSSCSNGSKNGDHAGRSFMKRNPLSQMKKLSAICTSLSRLDIWVLTKYDSSEIMC